MKRKGIPVCSACGTPYPDRPAPCEWCPAKPVESPSQDSEWWHCGHCGEPVDRERATCCWRCVLDRRHRTVSCEAPRHKGARAVPAYLVTEGVWTTAVKGERRRGAVCRACVGVGEVSEATDKTPPEALKLAFTAPKPAEWSCRGLVAGEWQEKGKQTYTRARGVHALESQYSSEWTHGAIRWTDSDGFRGSILVAYADLRRNKIEPEELTGFVCLLGDSVRVFCIQYDTRETMIDDIGYHHHSRDVPLKYVELFDANVWRHP